MSGAAENPYQSPQSVGDAPADIVDRADRDGLAAAVQRFLSGELTAFDFDEALDEFRASPDATVRFVAGAAWCFYDDCDDHLAALSTPEWDYFQRVLLLLRSDKQVTVASVRRWSWSQLLAVAGLSGFVGCGLQFGWGIHLLAMALPFGVLSIGISWIRRTADDAGPYAALVCPFGTLAELHATYLMVGNFRKQRYPPELGERRIRPPLATFAYHLQSYAMWLMFSPVALLVQALPTTRTQTRVEA